MATERELSGIRSRLFGLIAEERITAVDIDRPGPDVLAKLIKLADLASSVADALDELGVGGGIAGSTLTPRTDGKRIVGPAITIRYVPEGGSVGALLGRGERARLADRDLYNVGQPGDVAVFDCGGFVGASVMGGLSAAWGHRLQISGCVVDGAVRDVQSIRAAGLPVWSRGVTPVSGKHRMEAVEINGTVTVAGVRVRPGDVVVADDTGIAVVPASRLVEVCDIALRADIAERKVTDALGAGGTAEELASILSPDRW